MVQKRSAFFLFVGHPLVAVNVSYAVQAEAMEGQPSSL